MIRVAVISGNLGSYDQPWPWVEQVVPAGVSVEINRFSDRNFPARPKAMLPALQVGLLKMFGPDFVRKADVYLWVDASCALLRADSVAWFLERLGDADLLVFRHPDRQTIFEEWAFITERMVKPGEKYLTARYAGEWMGDLYRLIRSDETYTDDRLYASTAFMYRPNARVLDMMARWWFTKTRYSLHDQIAWPYVIAKAGCLVNVIEASYLKIPHLTYVRNKKRLAA